MVVSFTIDDSIAQQFRDGFCAATGYNKTSGITQDDWIKQKGIAWFKAVTKQGIGMMQLDAIAPGIDAATIS